MSHAIHFDTLAYANKLKDAGIPDKHAEAQSEALAAIFDDQVATKKDLPETEAKFEKALQETEARLIARMDGKFATMDNKLAEMKFDIIKWMVSLMFAQLFATSALILTVFKFLH